MIVLGHENAIVSLRYIKEYYTAHIGNIPDKYLEKFEYMRKRELVVYSCYRFRKFKFLFF